MRLAIIGGGISGMYAAHLLARLHEVTLFEAEAAIGGHTRTLDVQDGGESHCVDTGFIVCNDHTYPNFLRLMASLGVETQSSDMSFSVACCRSGIEYRASSLNTLFAQRRNLLNIRFWRMILDIARFRRALPELLAADEGYTLDEHLHAGGYGELFREAFLLPMGAAIWSADPERFGEFPAAYFAQFFTNHRILQLKDQPRWRTVKGGSRSYIEPLCRPFRERIRLSSPVSRVERQSDGVLVSTPAGRERFDGVVLGVHSDQALAMLADPSSVEREVLSAITYQPNRVVLHTDQGILPKTRRAWASWNVRVPAEPGGRLVMTYWMNNLQNLAARQQYCVTLNETAIDPTRVLDQTVLHHPVYTSSAFAAQKCRSEVNGVNRTWYCGAWWGYGFHEDGVNSALAVAQALGVSP